MLLTFGSGAQIKLSDEFEVEAGKPYQVIDAPLKYYFNDSEDNIISVKIRGIYLSVQKFSSTEMEELDRKMYKDMPKGAVIQKLMEVENGLIILFEQYDRKSKTSTLFGKKINYNDLSAEKPIKILTTKRPVIRGWLNEEGKQPVIPGANSNWTFGVKFNIHQSFDKSKILIQYRLKPNSRRDKINKDELGFWVFDNNFELLWSKEEMMPYTEAEMNNLAYTINGKGEIFMLAQMNETKSFELLKVTEDNDITTSKLDIENGIVFEKMKLIESTNGDITCAGYYANGIDYKVTFTFNGASGSTSFNCDGIYSFKVTENGDVSDIWKIPFSMELKKQYLNEKQQKKLNEREKKGNAGIPDLKMLEFYTQKDGSYIIVGEQQYMRSELYGPSTSNIYHYLSVVIAKISPDGELLWIKKIGKNQFAPKGDLTNGFYKGQMSIKYIRGNSKHYILYVDNPKNASLQSNQIPLRHKSGAGGYITAVEIMDNDGDLSRHTIAELADLDGVRAYQFNITRICEVSDNEFMMEVYKKKKEDAMIKLTLLKD